MVPAGSGASTGISHSSLFCFDEGFPLDFLNDTDSEEHDKEAEQQGHKIPEGTHPQRCACFGFLSGFSHD